MERPSLAAAVSTSRSTSTGDRTSPAHGLLCPPAALAHLSGHRGQLRRRSARRASRPLPPRRARAPTARPMPASCPGHDRVPPVEPLGREERCPHASTSRRSRTSPAYARSRRRKQPVGLLLRQLQEPTPGLDAEVASADVLTQASRSEEARCRDQRSSVSEIGMLTVDRVSPDQIGDGERAEERRQEAERQARKPRRPAPVEASPSSTIPAASLNIANWIRLATKPGPSPTDDAGGLPPRRVRALTTSCHHLLVGVGRQRSPRRTGRGEAARTIRHPQEPGGPPQPLGELRKNAGSKRCSWRSRRRLRQPTSITPSTADFGDSGRSKTASTIRSAPATAYREQASSGKARPRRRDRVSFYEACLLGPGEECHGALPRSLAPVHACCRREGFAIPLEANTCEIPTPIVPAPTIATRCGQRSLTATPSNKASSSAAPVSFGEPTRSRRWSSAPWTTAARSCSAYPDSPSRRRRADVREQALERRRQVVPAVEEPGRRRTPFRNGVLDEAKDGRCRHRDSEPVRDERRAAVPGGRHSCLSDAIG